jgi:hypothetical protein
MDTERDGGGSNPETRSVRLNRLTAKIKSVALEVIPRGLRLFCTLCLPHFRLAQLITDIHIQQLEVMQFHDVYENCSINNKLELFM